MADRRAFLLSAGSAGLASVGLGGAPREATEGPDDPDPPPLARPTGPAVAVARDEAYWGRVAAHYRGAPDVVNLEAGYFGQLAAPVLAALHRHLERVNRDWSWYARTAWPEDAARLRARVAATLGAAPDELAFTRNATEALHLLISGYRLLRPGDTVLYADLDYHSMRFAMEELARRRGVEVVRIALPEPLTREGALQAYADAFARYPRLRLVLLTHLNNLTGAILPVRDLVALARARGADAIVDAAHSFGQCHLRLDDLGADFVGLNLHKWLGAPLGAGVMVVRRGRLDALDPLMAAPGDPGASIDSRVHTGTVNFATMLAVADALDFHEAVGPAYKAARLRLLRDRWVGAARAIPGIDVLTADGRDEVAAITALRVHGRRGRADNEAVVRALLERHRILTVWRAGPAGGDVVRVTPGLHTRPGDLDRLVGALGEVAGQG